jgi:glycosyltransferase involved in cell wall biosynthesis
MKILVAGDPNSIHTSRFVSLLQELGHELHVFQSEHYYWQEEHLNHANIYVSHPLEPPKPTNRVIVTWPAFFDVRTDRAHAVASWAERLNADRPRAAELMRVLVHVSPDLVFSLKMQNDGYTVAQARALMGPHFRAPWVHFVWGTDIEFFGKNPEYSPTHLPRIRAVLENCDYLITDTRRDAEQVGSLGFRGRLLGTVVASGGFDFDMVNRIRANAPATRDVILVKARQGGYVGKALNVLRAIESIPEPLRGYRIVLIMATPEIVAHVSELDRKLGLSYELPGRLAYKELLALFARSRLAISATDVDGTPAFLLEAMAMGALPVHSNMDSVREWVSSGQNALLFPVDDHCALRDAILRGIADDELFERAAKLNVDTLRQRADRSKIRETVRGWLGEISTDSHAPAGKH